MRHAMVCVLALSVLFASPAFATGKNSNSGATVSNNNGPKNGGGSTDVDIDIYDKDMNTNTNVNGNHNRNSNNVDVDTRNNNRNNNDIDVANRNRNDVDVNNQNNNDVDVNNRNRQDQNQAQGQDQSQVANSSSNSNSNSNAISNANSNSNSNATSDNNNEINIEGDETFITYEEAANAAAMVYASQCQIAANAQNRNIGGGFVNETVQCRHLRQAQAYFHMMLANVEIVGPQIERYRDQIEGDLLVWEIELRSNQDEDFRQDLIKGSNDKSEAQIIAENRVRAYKRQLLTDLLQKRYEQYSEVEWLRVEQFDKYQEALDGFYNSIDSANVSIKRRGLTGFFAEFATDVAWPLGLAAVLFKSI